MIKYISLILVSSLLGASTLMFEAIIVDTKDGEEHFYINSSTESELYCYIETSNRYIDFYIEPYGISRWFKVPDYEWSYDCEPIQQQITK